jgi:hypothetical protein
MDTSTWNSFASCFETVVGSGSEETADAGSAGFGDPNIVFLTFCTNLRLLRATVGCVLMLEGPTHHAPDTIILRGTSSGSRHDRRQRKLRMTDDSRLTS